MTCHFGDCREVMRRLIADGVRVQMCVTSPPYFGLRDYGHDGQIGLEASPAEYVDVMVEVFSLVRDLLADDGTLWLNLGDSYAQQGGPGWQGKNGQRADRRFTATRDTVAMRDCMRRPPQGLKPKDLCGIPWRVAFALQADGWYLRSDIIWHKPNPMPESVTDRPTKAHEYLFLLAKNERYYYDAAAIVEQASDPDGPGNVVPLTPPDGFAQGSNGSVYGRLHEIGPRTTRNKRTVWTVPTLPYSGAHFATFPPELIEPCIAAGSRPGDMVLDPFFGSGTTGEVCERLGRKWLGIELNPTYESLQRERTAQLGMVFA